MMPDFAELDAKDANVSGGIYLYFLGVVARNMQLNHDSFETLL